MWTYIAIAVGGTLGCWARYGMTNLVQAIYGRDFRYATLSINVLGSFLMEFLFIETLERLTISPALRTGGAHRLLGGFHHLLDLFDGVDLIGRAGRRRESRLLSGSVHHPRPLGRIRRRLCRAQSLGRKRHGTRGHHRAYLSQRGRPRASKNLMQEILNVLHDQHRVRGVTVLRGIAGFGDTGEIHAADVLRLMVDLPLVIEFFDEPPVVQAALGLLSELVPDGRIVWWRATCR
jgi:uncharacterized protein